MRVLSVSNDGTGKREFSAIPGYTPLSPLKGGESGVKQPGEKPCESKTVPDQKAEWVRDNLPECASVAARFKAEFGDVKLVYASENGHVLGKASDHGDSAGNEQADDSCRECRHYKRRITSPDGQRLSGDCVRFKCLAIKRCADWVAR